MSVPDWFPSVVAANSCRVFCGFLASPDLIYYLFMYLFINNYCLLIPTYFCQPYNVLPTFCRNYSFLYPGTSLSLWGNVCRYRRSFIDLLCLSFVDPCNLPYKLFSLYKACICHMYIIICEIYNKYFNLICPTYFLLSDLTA